MLVSIQRWIDIFINFTTNSFQLKTYNVICIIFDKFIYKHYHKFCIITDEDTSTERITKIIMREMFKYYDSLILITLNKRSQFITTIWETLWCLLKIICKLLTIEYFAIDDQTKYSNQHIERWFRTYCNYI